MDLLKFYTDKEYKRLKKLYDMELGTSVPSFFDGFDTEFKSILETQGAPISSNPNSPISASNVLEALIPAIEFYGYKFFGKIIDKIQAKRNKRKEKKAEKKKSRREDIYREWREINSKAYKRYLEDETRQEMNFLEYPYLLDNNGDYINFCDLDKMPERLERLHSFINNNGLATDDQIVNLFYGYENPYLKSRYEITRLRDREYVVKISLKELKKEEILYFFSKTPFFYNISIEPIELQQSLPSQSTEEEATISRKANNNNIEFFK